MTPFTKLLNLVRSAESTTVFLDKFGRSDIDVGTLSAGQKFSALLTGIPLLLARIHMIAPLEGNLARLVIRRQ
jgi:hypothetical protein